MTPPSSCTVDPETLLHPSKNSLHPKLPPKSPCRVSSSSSILPNHLHCILKTSYCVSKHFVFKHEPTFLPHCEFLNTPVFQSLHLPKRNIWFFKRHKEQRLSVTLSDTKEKFCKAILLLIKRIRIRISQTRPTCLKSGLLSSLPGTG